VPVIDRLIISNFRRLQAFDLILRDAMGIEKIAAEFAVRVMFEPDAARRRLWIQRLQDRLISHAINDVLPSAAAVGRANANAIIGKIEVPKGIDLASPAERRSALFAGQRTAAERVQIIRMSITGDLANLDNRLTRYWLQPAEGSADDKLRRLREIHIRNESRRKIFESNLKAYHKGEVKVRPSKPALDFYSEAVANVKQDLRVQARRAGTDAELQTFKQAGHRRFGWSVPNGHSACPDCQIRAGAVLTDEQWARYGRPGSGLTICSSACFCMLVPVATFKAAPGLAHTLRNVKGVLTTAEQRAVFDANRYRGPAAAAA